MFSSFLLKNPPAGHNDLLNAIQLSLLIQTEFGIKPPDELVSFWQQVGAGYFGQRILYFFTDSEHEAVRDSLVTWNKKDFWREIYPPAIQGGPIFFAETCFGDQIGFRLVEGQHIYILFCIDTFEAFVIAQSAQALFELLAQDRFALVDEARYNAVSQRLGGLQAGMHYAPLVSPLIGGGKDATGFAIETPNVHFRTALATWQALNRR